MYSIFIPGSRIFVLDFERYKGAPGPLVESYRLFILLPYWIVSLLSFKTHNCFLLKNLYFKNSFWAEKMRYHIVGKHDYSRPLLFFSQILNYNEVSTTWIDISL